MRRAEVTCIDWLKLQGEADLSSIYCHSPPALQHPLFPSFLEEQAENLTMIACSGFG
jgi:hypothetical protein